MRTGMRDVLLGPATARIAAKQQPSAMNARASHQARALFVAPQFAGLNLPTLALSHQARLRRARSHCPEGHEPRGLSLQEGGAAASGLAAAPQDGPLVCLPPMRL